MVLSSLILPFVNGCDLFYPPAPETMIQIKNGFRLPVEVVGDVGYLLVELFQRVAYDSPPRVDKSTSKGFWQWGQVKSRRV